MSDVQNNESITDETPTNHTEFSVEEVEATRVCVYVDRAEVTRKIVLPKPAPGKHSLLIRGVTESADTNSIRVAGGKGSTIECTIHEVAFERNYITVDSSAHESKVKAAEEAFEKAQKKFKTLQNEREGLIAQRSLVSSYVKGILAPSLQGETSRPTLPSCQDLKDVEQLLEFQAAKDKTLADKLLELDTSISTADTQKSAARNELIKIKGVSGTRKVSRDVSILLSTSGISSAEDSSIVLEMSYMVINASWAPTYDLRVTISPPLLALTYQGVVSQSTGEDWKGVQLSLSTAAPATGGTPPAPPTQIVQWKRPSYPNHNTNMNLKKKGGSMIQQQQQQQMQIQMMQSNMQSNMMMPPTLSRRLSMSADELDSCDASELSDDDYDVNTGVTTTTVKSEGTGSATFTIEHPSTIESDSKEHKVTVMMTDLDPEFRHFATPALGEAAYLQARVRNSTAYPFLQTGRASIFLSGAFVTQTTIKATNPGEAFSIFLGVDSQVKISHNLIKKTTSKGNEGSMFKSKKDSSILNEYRTLIHNTKQDQPVRIQVVQLFPRSSDTKIQVELIKPPRSSVPMSGREATDVGGMADEKVTKKKKVLALGEFDVTQNSVTNNIVFAGEIGAGQKSEITYSYEIQWTDVDAEIEIVKA